MVLYARTGEKLAAAEAAGITLRTLNRKIERGGEHYDSHFADAMDAAHERWIGTLRRAAYSRAVEGWVERKGTRGGQVLEVRKFSDVLLLALLKAKDPAFKDRVAIDSTVRGHVDHGGSIKLEGLDPEDLATCRNLLLKNRRAISEN